MMRRTHSHGGRTALTLTVAGSALLLAACSSPTPKANTTTTSGPTTTVVPTAACAPAAVTATVQYTTIGGSATAPAGAVVFVNTSNSPCSLHGVPTVQLVGGDGQVIPTFQAPSSPANAGTAVLASNSSPGLHGSMAASSVTWSSLTCVAGSYSLAVRFPGWSTSVPAGSTAGYSGPACTEADQTVYVSPVQRITATAPAASSTTTG
jgi:hypothetical protein